MKKAPTCKNKYDSVRALLNSERRWMKHSFAASKKPRGLNEPAPATNWVNPMSESATCFCLVGACRRIYPEGAIREEALTRIMSAIRELFPNFDPVSVTQFNDYRKTTHKQIKAVIRKANV